MKKKIPPLAELPVILYPEVVGAALKAKEGDLFAIWCILKAIDVARDGSGKFRTTSILKLTAQIMGVSEKHSYALLNKGVGKYWNKPGGKKGNRVTQIFGRGVVFERLSPDMTRSEPFVFKLRDFEADGYKNWPSIKAMLVGVVASRHTDLRPVSLQAIQNQTGLSRRTIQDMLARCEHIKRVVNYAQVLAASSYEEARREHTDITLQSHLPHRIELQNGKLCVMRQLPNSYQMISPARLPLRKRPKELRLYDSNGHAPLRPKLYFDETPIKKKPSEFYLSMGLRIFNQVGLVKVWEHKTRTHKSSQHRIAARALAWRQMLVQNEPEIEEYELENHV